MSRTFVSICMLCLVHLGLQAAVVPVANADFEAGTDQSIESWTVSQGTATRLADGDEHFVRMVNQSQGRVILEQEIDIPKDLRMRDGTLSAIVRTADYKRGEKSYQSARITLDFLSPEGKMIRRFMLVVEEQQDEWKALERSITVPGNAVKLKVWPGMFFQSGTFDLKQITLTVD
ncbi:MAG: hypothetical protein PF961_11785 [Planctomycetota bacterium]|jgi:hypothetical protein|nr:hypothetical protein [Planctomycetota bacterium]